ncbi:MAG: hypothetical protein KF745_08985 [Phycisphaeraceae bacterium]|nr:hypothetical protein [Phycisphaeraceae bacterium]
MPTLPNGPTAPPATHVSLRFCCIAFAVLMLVMTALYWNSLDIPPAGDDYPALSEIQRGNEFGVMSLFSKPLQGKNYRPLQSLVVWAVGNIGGTTEERTLHQHVLNLVSAAVYVLAVLLWARAMPLTRVGVGAAGLVATLHPAFAAVMVGLDTWSSTLAPAMMWLMALGVYHLRHRAVLMLVVTVPLFVVAALTKEYAFALVLMAPWIMLYFREQRRWVSAIVTGLVLSAVMLTLLWARRFTSPVDVPEMPKAGPQYLPYNFALYASALLLPVNTVWVFINRSNLFVLGAAGLGGVATATWLTLGLWTQWRASREPHRAVRYGSFEQSPAGWMVFLLAAFVAATFPNNVLLKVSEVYVVAPLVVLALLCGLAADGYRSMSWGARVTAALGAGAWVVAAVVVVQMKIAATNECGRMAEHQARQILSYLAPNAVDRRIGLVFLRSEIQRDRGYSVYKMPDELPLYDAASLDWYRPEAHLRTTQLIVGSLSRVDSSRFDVTLVWSVKTKEFTPVTGRLIR